jgi:hypothetical protein
MQGKMEALSGPATSAEHCFGSRRPRRRHPKKKPVLELETQCPDIEVTTQFASSGRPIAHQLEKKTPIEQDPQCLKYKAVIHPLSIDRKRRRHFKENFIAEPEPQCMDGKAPAGRYSCNLPSQNNRHNNRRTSDELEATTIASKAAARAHRLREPHRSDRPRNIKELSEPITHLPLSDTPSQLSHSILPPPAVGAISSLKRHPEAPLPYPSHAPNNCVLPEVDSDYHSCSLDDPLSNTCVFRPEALAEPEKLSPEQHNLVEKVRAGIVDYRFQSLSHFSLHIDVRPSECMHSTETEVAHDFKMKIMFQNYSKQVPVTCRSSVQTEEGIALQEVQVHEGSDWTSLRKSLEKHFPVTSADVSVEDMRNWWCSNGKFFRWSDLPTELKEIVIQYCMCQPFNFGDYFYSLKGFKLLKSNSPGPSEIIGMLGEWGHLLGVSAEIRKLTLQLCFRGGWLYPQGLSILVNSHRHFEESICRLGSYYQIFDCDSVPKESDHMAVILARLYKYFPKIYPELRIYGTFMHGIRKVYLEFDFWSSVHFFKVSVCDINKYRPKDFMTCDVLERLPLLNSIYFYLPTRETPKNDSMRYGPRLFHSEKACPRSLHRLIYEQAAIELASYQGVHMKMFMDQDEEERFLYLYAAAKSNLQFTKEELNQLWEDSDGGIQLDLDIDSVTGLEDCDQTKSVYEHDTRLDGAGNITLTPYCQCEDPCSEAFAYAGRY